MVAVLAACVALGQHRETLANVPALNGFLRHANLARVINGAIAFLGPPPRVENGCQCGVSATFTLLSSDRSV